MSGTLVWFDRDLRLADQPALVAAASRDAPIVPVHVVGADDEWRAGAASRWWLHHSLTALADSLDRRGSKLVVRRGEPHEELLAAARHVDADRLHFGSPATPAGREQRRRAARAARDEGLAVESFETRLLLAPEALRTTSGGPYRVFTPFWRALQQAHVEPPQPAPARLPAPARWPASVAIEDLGLLPRIDWASGLRREWTPGEAGAARRVDAFLGDAASDYDERRDIPGVDGTSRLSPHLHFGEVSVRALWQAVRERQRDGRTRLDRPSADAYLRQLAWREFGAQLLHHFPHTATESLREEFERFPWRASRATLEAWQEGRTGYPLVDAAMRQLWETGWMHGRCRMVVASFLVKHLLTPWQDGARWFWDTLVDADLANNTLGWQWTAGCGADAAPFFRIFNPTRQAERLDADAAYVSRWLPELAELARRAPKLAHAPWTAGAVELEAAGLRLGRDYPEPIVDHAEARARALAAWKKLRGEAK